MSASEKTEDPNAVEDLKITYLNDQPLCSECGKAMSEDIAHQFCSSPICQECEDRDRCKHVLWRILICLFVTNVVVIGYGVFQGTYHMDWN